MIAPAKIMFIRHGEKPPKDDVTGPDGRKTSKASAKPPFGITPDGEKSRFSLTVRGWTRAGALVGLFMRPPTPLERPAVIYAAAPELKEGSLHGQRPTQTVTPLADRLGLTINQTWPVTQEVNLAAALCKEVGPVLVCWEHHNITAIVAEIVTGFNRPFPDRFDLVWVLAAESNGYTFVEVPQLLLAGDT
jgi:hypothetical protein